MTDVELVIKVPKELYIALLNGYEEPYSQMFSDVVKNGTPLPKGHGRFIDADALDIDNLNRAYDNNFELDFGRLYTADVIDMVANAPTIIEADKENE